MAEAALSTRTKAGLLLVVFLLVLAGRQDSSAEDSSPADDADAEARLKKLNLDLPKAPAPVANYVGAVRTGDLLFLAGAGPQKEDGTYLSGRLGEDFSIEQGYEAARLTALFQLATLKSELGDLNRVKRVVKVLGMVNSAPSFTDQPKVINGFSDLIVEVFGDRGKHARSAVGMAVLPFNIPVEVEMIVEVE
jgi:enamine deaminase RidA (YjgF/YER057c/UK114 family)